MLACTWKDKRIIHFISTVNKPTEVFLHHMNKQGQIDNVQSLEVVQEYNRNMSGVHWNDQMAALPTNAKQCKWYMDVVWKAFLWSLYNAYIIGMLLNTRHITGLSIIY